MTTVLNTSAGRIRCQTALPNSANIAHEQGVDEHEAGAPHHRQVDIKAGAGREDVRLTASA